MLTSSPWRRSVVAELASQLLAAAHRAPLGQHGGEPFVSRVGTVLPQRVSLVGLVVSSPRLASAARRVSGWGGLIGWRTLFGERRPGFSRRLMSLPGLGVRPGCTLLSSSMVSRTDLP
jgi:hypothetical protein